jgi:hypothetical protein
VITTLGLLISGVALLAVLLNAVPLYLLGRLPNEYEDGASVLCLVFVCVFTVILFAVSVL